MRAGNGRRKTSEVAESGVGGGLGWVFRAGFGGLVGVLVALYSLMARNPCECELE